MTIRITHQSQQLLYEFGSNLEDPQSQIVQSTADCCEFNAALVTGDTAAVITVVAGSPDVVDGVVIRVEGCLCGYSDSYIDAYCDPTEAGLFPNARISDLIYTIVDLPPNSILTIDAAERSVTLTDVAGVNQLGGIDMLDWWGLFEWIEASGGGCEKICVDATGATINTDTTVAISIYNREL